MIKLFYARKKVFALARRKFRFYSELCVSFLKYTLVFIISFVYDMLISSFALIVFSMFVYYFPAYYISELSISFFPYLIVLNLIFLIILFVRFRKFKNRLGGIKKLFVGIFILLHGFVFLIYSREFNSFYNIKLTDNIQWIGWLKMLYANIHKDNNDYTWIRNMIEKQNPDLLMFVEFGENHYNNLKDFLQQRYPYINSTTWSKKFVGSMVFSKYPIENWADDFPQWNWRYAYFQLKLNKKDYYIYLVHTSSPDSNNHYIMRNEQLKSFLDNFRLHQSKHRDNNDNVMIVGDFNVSPWSIFYKRFQNWLWSGFVNLTRQPPILFTWYLLYVPIFWSHIDHVWVNFDLKNLSLKSIKIDWSDHRGLLIKIDKIIN